jgi:hypothetical protein
VLHNVTEALYSVKTCLTLGSTRGHVMLPEIYKGSRYVVHYITDDFRGLKYALHIAREALYRVFYDLWTLLQEVIYFWTLLQEVIY